MYKKNLVVTLVLLLIITFPLVSLANSLSLRSSSKVTEPSKTFTLFIYMDSSSVKSYTAQANIDFPADLISVESFTYASSWFPISQTGYDSIDNTSGKLIKTAGYPNGFNSEILFGTLTIKVKKAGLISINVNKNSYILDMDSNNTITSYNSFSINSSVPEVKTVTPPPVTNPVVEKPTVTKPPVVDKKETPIVKKEEPKVEILIEEVDQKTKEEEIRNRTLINNLFMLFNGGSTLNKIFNILLGFR